MTQLRRDFLIHGERDGQAIFDALGANQKKLLWIEESNRRFYAYNHFGQHPERLIGWFDQHWGGADQSRRSPAASVEPVCETHGAIGNGSNIEGPSNEGRSLRYSGSQTPSSL